MNTKPTFKFPSVDTVLNALIIGGMTVGCAVLIVVQTVQSVAA